MASARAGSPSDEAAVPVNICRAQAARAIRRARERAGLQADAFAHRVSQRLGSSVNAEEVLQWERGSAPAPLDAAIAAAAVARVEPEVLFAARDLASRIDRLERILRAQFAAL
jgi:transcriptional regulator with XRE-family HTH domain